ncbi:16S rRNA (uracil(1498)-N(3))-methyltransferase [Parasegetibacter sp. NRK P23]|uniref:RsmE family RNA methyltransferase n=1 Tax=Parasegetibacter sp. NRK P23 TaxID=2942999 RepID=UPI0020431E43|nr:RsmE family RNA methyltransferase [Parasegetibacter sp. NRK P23]MCM5527522.1 16S rRNA (uracil(1498)-N(3))-methyltransferase [Parasegetibacter sp. NRK P23]
MALPYFYQEQYAGEKNWILDEDTSKHCVQVLRMEAGEKLVLTNGKGLLATVQITDPHKKKCGVTLVSVENIPAPAHKQLIGISLLKNASRFEWFLEKATELGINGIVPLLCKRTERQHFREERLKGILIAAMLQSQKAWLPELYTPQSIEEVVKIPAEKKFIAHCMDSEKTPLKMMVTPAVSQYLLIGPEGDFTEEEVISASNAGFQPVSLGNFRLRTETAGIYGAVTLMM